MVALLLADGFEEVEAITPVDILRRAGIEVVTFAIGKEQSVYGAHNIMVDADDFIDNIDYEEVEAVILPGGLKGTENLEGCRDVKHLLEYMYDSNKLMCAICAAPTIYGKLGYLRGKNATCFPGCEEHLKGAEYTNSKVEVDGRFITSKGMGTAMDFALAIVEYIKDKETADNIASTTQYK